VAGAFGTPVARVAATESFDAAAGRLRRFDGFDDGRRNSSGDREGSRSRAAGTRVGLHWARNLIVAGSIRPDVFISVTPGPMRIGAEGGQGSKRNSHCAHRNGDRIQPKKPIRSGRWAKAGAPGAKLWWQILETPGFRFGRTDPNTDPQGLNIIFMMQLAARYYHQPDLAEKILGPQINPQQIFQEPQVMARLQAGQLDASSAYKNAARSAWVAVLSLPPEINLGSASMEKEYQQASVKLNGKAHQPSPLVFYAAVLKHTPQPKLASRFVAWLQGSEARQILSHYHYDDPGDDKPLVP